MTIDVTVTFGMPSSASTWAFNVARELVLLRHHGRNVESFYSDDVARVWQVLNDNQHLQRKVVWKLHEPDDAWAVFLSDNQVPLILSIRDPRDAMLSLMERFGETMQGALHRISTAAAQVIESVAFGHFGLRYEDRFFEKPDVVSALAAYLGVALSEPDRDRIFSTYGTEAVKLFAQGIDTLPATRIRRIERMHYDETTQIHTRHIGDQRIGKWRDRFDADEQKLLNGRFAAFLKAFGYDLE